MPPSGTWETCRECPGAALGEGRCLAHIPTDERHAYLAALREGATLDARGVSIGRDLLDEILEAAPPAVRFDGADFADDARFGSVRFKGDASFAGATFALEADFHRTVFEGAARFGGASFAEDAHFGGAVFKTTADFSWLKSKRRAAFNHARFVGKADFTRATFEGKRLEDGRFEGGVSFNEASFDAAAEFTRATVSGQGWFSFAMFAGEAWFNEARFSGHTFFGGATFKGSASFFDTTFDGINALNFVRFEREAVFRSACFSGDTVFDETRFAGQVIFEQATVVGTLSLRSTIFEAALTLEASTDLLACTRARFVDGAHLRLRRAAVPPVIALGGAEFGGSSLVEGAARFTDLQESRREDLVPPRDGGAEDRAPRVATVRLANVANLVLSEVDLRGCLFAGAHSLDRLRLENVVPFAPSPAGRRWTKRRAIAEEHEWRSHRRAGEVWYGPECQRPEWLQTEPGLTPSQTAAVYRALRKGREDNKDEPGAADFYYGEMEMRRHDAAAPLGERVILWLYWLLSGYALRASRAFVALLTAVLLFAFAFQAWGFAGDEGMGDALLFSAGTSVRVASAQDHTLSSAGDAFHIALGIAGPVLLGLALLSIRGRVKR